MAGSSPPRWMIVEWRIKTQRRLFFCDANGFPLDETSPGIHAPGFEFTAYLKSDYFAELVASNILESGQHGPGGQIAVSMPLKRSRESTFANAPPRKPRD